MKSGKLQISREIVLNYVKKLGHNVEENYINLPGFLIMFCSRHWKLCRLGDIEQGEYFWVDICTEFYDQMTDFKKLDAALDSPGQFAIQENNKIINDILDKLD